MENHIKSDFTLLLHLPQETLEMVKLFPFALRDLSMMMMMVKRSKVFALTSFVILNLELKSKSLVQLEKLFSYLRIKMPKLSCSLLELVLLHLDHSSGECSWKSTQITSSMERPGFSLVYQPPVHYSTTMNLRR